MILGFDSSYTLPDDAGLRQAKADGVGVWAGYITTKPSGIATWPKSNFDRIKAAGLGTWGYCSGWDDPAALKAQAAAWGIRIILDVENGIRGDGSWVQSFLDTSGAGLYGSISVFSYRRAACYVEASYPGGASPKATWPNASPPNGPHGWQSQGSHSAYGATVDSGYYDDWFGGATPAPQPQGDQDVPIFAYTTDPNSAHDGQVFLVANPPYGPKRYVPYDAIEGAYASVMTDATLHTYPGYVIDAMETEDPGEDYGDALAALAAQVAKITAGTVGPTGPAGPAGPAVTSVTISGTYPVK